MTVGFLSCATADPQASEADTPAHTGTRALGGVHILNCESAKPAEGTLVFILYS